MIAAVLSQLREFAHCIIGAEAGQLAVLPDARERGPVISMVLVPNDARPLQTIDLTIPEATLLRDALTELTNAAQTVQADDLFPDEDGDGAALLKRGAL